MSGGSNRQGKNSIGEGESIPVPTRPGNLSVCKYGYGNAKGNKPSRVGGERCVAVQRTESVGGTTVSSAMTIENLTIVASRTITQARWGTGLPPPYGDAGRYSDSTETA